MVEPYGTCGLARIADGADAFAAAIAAALADGRCSHLNEVDELLGRGSWEHTAAEIRQLMLRAVAMRAAGTDPFASGALAPEELP